jgi:hypothetical protein
MNKRQHRRTNETLTTRRLYHKVWIGGTALLLEALCSSTAAASCRYSLGR